MTGRLGAALISLIVLNSCTSMKPTDFKESTPALVIEDYFAGETRAWGLFEDRFGTLRRQFTVDITGTWDGDQLVLDERFRYSDGDLILVRAEVGDSSGELRMWLEREGELFDAGPRDGGIMDAGVDAPLLDDAMPGLPDAAP